MQRSNRRPPPARRGPAASGLGYWIACLVNFDKEWGIALGSALACNRVSCYRLQRPA